MSLKAGARVGPYEIQSALAAGGMGEVYRARDTKLDREVAVKVLPLQLAADPMALARFEREAKAVAALSHPNILSIFDFGSDLGTTYAVMELLVGSTLRGSLNGSPIPVRKALDYAVQIARGLAAAHERGIVHRDLKPENLFITDDGRVKILDFGLARQAPAAPAGVDVTGTPTFARLTDPGTVLGTVGYMSPEQVRGEPGDQRSDLFSFGSVLYEMISGRRAFQEQTAPETMTAILKTDPPDLADSTVPGLSPALVRVVQHCLEKNPAERFQSASDVAFALTNLSTVSQLPGAHDKQTAAAPAPGPNASGASAPGRQLRRLWLAAAAAALLAVATGAFFAGQAMAPSPGHVSFTPLTHRQQTLYRALFAPDGKTIVFSASLGGNRAQLFTSTPEYPEPRSLGIMDAQLLSVSSKNELAILTNAHYVGHRLYVGTLARIPLGGGAPREILENVREADWSPDASTLAIIRNMNGRDRLEFPIGKVLYEASGYLSDLRISPAGNQIAFFEHPLKGDDRGALAVVDLNGKKTTLADGYAALEGLAWSRDGREILFSGGSSYPTFKVMAASLSGHLRPALESAGGLTLHDIAADGRWLATRDDITEVLYARAPGSSEDANLSWLDYSMANALSSDGQWVLFNEESSAVGRNYAVAYRKTDGSPVIRLGEGEAFDLSPDNKWALAMVPGARAQIMVYSTGAGESLRLESGSIEQYTTGRWFPDGKRVLLCGNEPGRAERCYVQGIGGGLPQPVTPEDTHEGIVSPDGALVLARRGVKSMGATHFELYPVAGGAPKPMPGLEETDDAIRWSPDGRSVFVRHGLLPARIDRVDVDTGRHQAIETLFSANAPGAVAINNVVLASDPTVYAYDVTYQLSQLFLVQGAN